MIIREILQRVQSLYSKGVQSDDSRLSFRHIYSKVLTSRDKLMTQKINKRQLISQWNYQTINCVELVKAQPYECPCLPAVGCEILKTKYPLPKPLTGLLEGHVLQSVTSLDGSVVFSKTTWENKKYKKGSKFTKAKPDYYIRGDYLYITTKSSPRYISVTGLFEDPLEVLKYPNSCEKECEDCYDCISPLDRDLPIDKNMVETLVEMAAQELIALFSQGKEDTTNNSRDNIIEETK